MSRRRDRWAPAACSASSAVVRDSWRLVWSADRPVAVRAQALAFVLAGGRGVGIAGVTRGRGGWRAAVAGWTRADRATGSGADTESVGRPEPEPKPEPVRQPVAERHAIGVTDGDGRADRDRRADRNAGRDRRFLGPGIRIGFGERLVRARLRRRDGATDQRLVRARVGWTIRRDQVRAATRPARVRAARDQGALVNPALLTVTYQLCGYAPAARYYARPGA